MKKTWTWAVAGYGLTYCSFDRMIEICRTAGFSGIEGAPPLFEGKSEKELREIGASFRDADLSIATFHLPFTLEDDISAFYETERRRAVDRMKSWMQRAAWVGSQKVIQHPSTRGYETTLEGFDRFMERLRRSLGELLPFAEERGITIALENLLPRDGSRFFSQAEHFAALGDITHPCLGFCLDTGHALIAAGREAFGSYHSALLPLIVAYHLADNAGDRDSHLAPGHGNVPWNEVFHRLAASRFSGSACVETPPFAAGPDYSVEAWTELRVSMDRLCDDALGT